MSNIAKFIKEKGKIIFIPMIIVSVLLSIYTFNGYQKSDTTIVKTEDGTYIKSSGMVESNFVTISSETAGNIIETEVNEGDRVKAGQVLAKVNNTSILNQYDKAKFNLEIANQNVKSIQSNIENFNIQNEHLINQAKSAYLASEGEYENIVQGASSYDIEQAEEAVNVAKINLEYTEESFTKSKKLFDQGAMPQNQLEEIEKNYNIALSQYNSANLKLNSIRSGPKDAVLKAAKNKMLQAKSGYDLAISNGNTQIEQLKNQLELSRVQVEQARNLLEQSKIELDKTEIKSPIDGILNLLTFKEGEFVSVGKNIAEIYDPNSIEIKVYVSEANIGHVKVGQSVEIFADSHSDKKFNGKIKRINDKAEFTPKNIQTKEERVNTVFEVKIEVLDTDGVIKAGMPVDVNIKID